MAAKRKSPKHTSSRSKKGRRWSAAVTKNSDALDLENRAFASHDPKRVAQSLKRSALRSKRRKAGPYQSAMSMLNFYMNRAGRNLPASQKKVLARAKDELRHLFGRDAPKEKAPANRHRSAHRGSRKRGRAAA